MTERTKSWAERVREGTPPPKPPECHLAVARWFRLVGAFGDKERQHLTVNLSADQCREVARLLEVGIGLTECKPSEAPPDAEEFKGPMACPFCASIDVSFDPDIESISCSACTATGPTMMAKEFDSEEATQDAAAAAWNTRF